jgi:hypothetical protein
MSRKSGQNQSTLGKLSQIAHILEAAGILARSPVPGYLTIVDQFFTLIELRSHHDEVNARSPSAISSILNRNDRCENFIAQKRRDDFQDEVNLNGFSDGRSPGTRRHQ